MENQMFKYGNQPIKFIGQSIVDDSDEVTMWQVHSHQVIVIKVHHAPELKIQIFNAMDFSSYEISQSHHNDLVELYIGVVSNANSESEEIQKTHEILAQYWANYQYGDLGI